MAILVLRDIPKEQVDLDALTFAVEGGFRGFQSLLPGYHVVTVYDGARNFRREVVLPEPRSVAVLRHDGTELVPDESDDGARMAELAAAGAMNRALVDGLAAGPGAAQAWQLATGALDRPASEVALLPDIVSGDSRFGAFFAQHHGDPGSALRELQAAFVQLFFEGDFRRLRHLLQAHYHAGGRAVGASPDYFARVAGSISGMLQLRRDLVAPGSAATEGALQLVEDLRVQGLATAADSLAASLRPIH
jgi:hypothetical protein